MTYVITQACIGTKDASCAPVCPVDCIHDGGDQYYINPDECIDCGACLPTCPVSAIYQDSDVPENLKSFIAKNAEMAKKGPVKSGAAAKPETKATPAPAAAKPAVAAPAAAAPAAPANAAAPPPSAAKFQPAAPVQAPASAEAPPAKAAKPTPPPAAPAAPQPTPKPAPAPPASAPRATQPAQPARAPAAGNPQLVEAITRNLADFFARALHDAITKAVQETEASAGGETKPVYLTSETAPAAKPAPPQKPAQ